MKYDIGLVYMMNYNIGNCLTNYALYRFLRNNGKNVIVINVHDDAPYSDMVKIEGPLKHFIVNPYDSDDVICCKTRKDTHRLNALCKTFILGSDQVWRKEFIGVMEYHTALNWVSGERYKIAYASTFGVIDDCEEDYQYEKLMKYYLNRFNEISVRDRFSMDFIRKKYGMDVSLCVDPVFLLDVAEYIKISDCSNNDVCNHYCFAYFLDITNDKEKTVDYISKKERTEYRAMTEPICETGNNRLLKYEIGHGVNDFLNRVINAEYVVTDSFHGVCFSLIFEKPFVLFFEPTNWRGYDRIMDLLNEYELSNRLIDRYDEKHINGLLEDKIDYKNIKRKLNGKIKLSKEWILSACKRGEAYKGTSDVYDTIYTEMIDNDLKIKEITNTLHGLEERLTTLDSTMIRKLGQIRTDIMGLSMTDRNREQNNERKSTDTYMVVGWGVGKCFKKHAEFLTNTRIMKYVVDKNSFFWGKKVAGDIICISPDELSKMKDDVFVVVTVENPTIEMDIVRELIGMGILRFEHLYNWISQISF